MALSLISATSVNGTGVENISGQDLGKVIDLMINISNGKVVYAVLHFDDFLGFGGKYFAIPWSSFVFKADFTDKFILNVSKEKLENAPGFDKDNWPTKPMYEYLSKVDTYYGNSTLADMNK